MSRGTSSPNCKCEIPTQSRVVHYTDLHSHGVNVNLIHCVRLDVQASTLPREIWHMSYTIATRARRCGIFFERHELEPVRIYENSTCWGVWVEGREFDKHSRLDGDTRWHHNETPHLIVSPIHPNFWPTAFNIRILLQRRPIRPGETKPEHHDAFFGLSDALARCGVNILFVQTAQIGYDLISFDAICELPQLRDDVSRLLLDPCDRAGEEMEAARAAARSKGLSANEAESTLMNEDQKLFKKRVAYFQALGLLLTPRLAELEAQLLIMERQRFKYWDVREKLRLRETEALRTEREALESQSQNGDTFRLIVGRTPADLSPAERKRLYCEAMTSAWFFNSKVVAAGENLYFLSYHSIQTRPAARKLLKQLIDANKLSSYGSRRREQELVTLFKKLHATLTSRRLGSSLEKVIPTSPGGKRDEDEWRPHAGTAERLMHTETDGSFESMWYQSFQHRQALEPVRISALPSLAYARFWALGGATGRGDPIPFRYRNHLLRPDCPATESAAKMRERLYNFLTDVTHCKEDPSRGKFDPEMAVLASVNLQEQCVRLRFAREQVEPQTYLTVAVTYRVETEARIGPNSQGLLHHLIHLMLHQHFRVERASNVVNESDTTVEKGEVEVIARAIDEVGVRFCKRMTLAESNHAHCQKWAADLYDRTGWPQNRNRLELVITCGFVPEDR